MKQLGLICVTWLAAASAGATSMVPLDLKALVSRADRVVLATVVSEESHWTDNHDAIYTDSVVRVDRSYKGALKPGETVVVRREGGSVDGIAMRVYGAAQLAPGEQAVVFLENRGAATWVVGMSQGKWRVTLVDGKRVVHAADLSGIAFLKPGVPAQAGARSLADVERAIRTTRVELERAK